MKQNLLVIVAILLLQLFLRTHHTDTLPGYADESLHIRRAEIAWGFWNPVASYQPGKLMLYYYLGLFKTERIHALVISRMAVALISLLGGVGIYALGKSLHSARAGLVAMFAYAVTPFAIFFDRMALADPLALVIFALAGWSLLNWARHPTTKRSIVSSILLILTPFAKLTGAGIVAAPLLALLLFRKQSTRTYLRPLMIVYGIFAAAWILLMIPPLLGEIRGGENRMELVDEYLLNAYEEDQSFLPNLIDNVWDAFQQIGIYTWTPALLLTVALGLILVFLRWRAAAFLWGLLILAWLPTLAGSEMARTRYLTLGLPFLILLLVIGLYALIDRLPPDRRRLLERIIFMGMLIYALGWGLPFFRETISDPTALALPERDRWRYMQAVTAGYGQQEAVNYLENDLAREAGNPVEVFGILGSCHLMRLFLQEPGPVILTCAELEAEHQLAAAEIDEIEAAGANGSLYLLIERDLGTNFDDLDFEWDFVRDFTRPHEGVTIELWGVRPR